MLEEGSSVLLSEETGNHAKTHTCRGYHPYHADPDGVCQLARWLSQDRDPSRHPTHHATQDEVAKYLGPPHLTRELSTGGAVWLYGFTYPSGSIGCATYVLTFDRESVLRSWQWQPSCPQGFRF